MGDKSLIPMGNQAMTPEQEYEAMVNHEASQEKNAYEFKPPVMSFKGGAFVVADTEFSAVKPKAIVLLSRELRAMWPEGDDAVEPECSSRDGRKGVVRLNGAVRECRKCPHNQWGSAVDKDGNPTKGKRCGEYRLLIVQLDGFAAPVRLRLPVTSIGNWDAYCSALAMEGGKSAYFSVVTQFSLLKATRGAQQEYFVAQFAKDRPLTLPELREVIGLRNRYQELIEMAEAAEVVGDQEGTESRGPSNEEIEI